MNRLLVISVDGLRAADIADPRIRLPNLRAIMDRGGAAARLKAVFPTVTWAIHTSLVTGCLPASTGIFGNAVYDRAVGRRLSSFDPEELLFDRDQKRESLFGAFRKKDAKIATVCWPLTQGAASIDLNIPEFYAQAHFEGFSTPALFQELKDHGLPVDRYGAWSADHAMNSMQDALTRDIALHLEKKHRPDATFLHFLLVDSYQHDFGVGSPEAVYAMEYVDGLVADVVGDRSETNIVLFSDHGHAPSPQSFRVDAWLKERGFDGAGNAIAFAAVSNGGAAFIYRLDGTAAEGERLERELAELPWVNGVWARKDFAKLGLPTEDSGPRGFLPELVFEAAPGYFVKNGESPGIVVGESACRSMHGYRPEWEEMDGFLACAGPDFAEGIKAAAASVLDVAPTLNEIYGLGLRDMDGRVIDAFLAEDRA